MSESQGIPIAGRSFIARAITGEDMTYFDHNNAYIGVGDGQLSFDENHTDLQGSNKEREGMENNYPIVNENRITFKASFGEGDALFEWNEWGIFNASSDGTMLFRKVETRGTKVLAVWNFTVILEVVE